MFRSTSKSGSVEVAQKNHHSSVFSRTFSATKLCRGDGLGSQIDSKALTSLDKKPPKISNLSENRVTRVMSMQRHMGGFVKKMNKVEKDGVFDQQSDELMIEVENMKSLLSKSKDELKIKDERIKSLELELNKTRELDAMLLHKDSVLRNFKEKEKSMVLLLSESKKTVENLEAEVEKQKLAEKKVVDCSAIQTKEFEATRIQLEKSKSEISSLRSKIEAFERTSTKEEIQSLTENLAQAKEHEKKLLAEMDLLKSELKLALEAEEKSRNAMEDLALALKEVAVEANQGKGKIGILQVQLELARVEAGNLKKIVDEAKQEAELHKNTSNRLRFEAEETLLAWNGKEMGFIGCVKRAEEERAFAESEKNEMRGELRKVIEETKKLRDIMKQAVNESSASKAAARIARDENIKLKDLLSEKSEALSFLRRENERLRVKTEECEKSGKILNFNLEDLELINDHEDTKGETPKAERRRASSEDDNSESSNDNDSDGDDRNSEQRMKVMFQQMGNILMNRRSFHKKNLSLV